MFFDVPLATKAMPSEARMERGDFFGDRKWTLNRVLG
jgi:hypothetical protein